MPEEIRKKSIFYDLKIIVEEEIDFKCFVQMNRFGNHQINGIIISGVTQERGKLEPECEIFRLATHLLADTEIRQIIIVGVKLISKPEFIEIFTQFISKLFEQTREIYLRIGNYLEIFLGVRFFKFKELESSCQSKIQSTIMNKIQDYILKNKK